MGPRNIIVIGASSGGFEAIKLLISQLPSNLDAAIFIVWHMSPDVRGILPEMLNKQNGLYAAHAVDREPILYNRIYIAPPDRHLLIEKGQVRVSHGPKENRFRPAVDPLFRSAANSYGAQVIGVILSGALDDGTAGLWSIKNKGGIAIVQDPNDAIVSSMPESALREVNVDYCLPILEMASVLETLSKQDVVTKSDNQAKHDQQTNLEVQVATQDSELPEGVILFGDLSPYACPECHGVLSVIKEGQIKRYRCHTGHAYSVQSLLSMLTENIETSLWGVIRGIEESIILLNEMGDHYAEINRPQLAAAYFQRASEAQMRCNLIKQAFLDHDHLRSAFIQQSVDKESP